jgi:peroxiredoxin
MTVGCRIRVLFGNESESMTDLDRTDGSVRVPRWLKAVLAAAGVYNLLWGASMVLFPHWLWDAVAATRPNYPELWQCIGMIVGVYGLGYLIAARDPLRHWPIVLVGLLGKVFGPIGFLQAVLAGTFPPAFGWTILTNDLLWWIPFGMLLWLAFKHYGTQGAPASTDAEFISPRDAMAATRIDGGDGAGRTLLDLSDEAPRLVLFLRHTGCTFCREAAADLATKRAAIEARGVRPVVVLLSADSKAAKFLESYGLADVSRVSDPSGRTYRAFGLRRGSLWQLFGPAVVWRGFVAGILQGHGVGTLEGDGFQMPGTFVVHRGEIVKASPAQSAADRPDLDGLACVL